MSAIQNAASFWIDGFDRLGGGQIGRQVRSGAIDETAVANPALWGSDASHSMTSVISDVEEEGEIADPHQELHAATSTMDTLSADLEAGNSDLSVADEIIAATAKQIGVIEAARRCRQSGRQGKFDDHDADDSEDPTDESFAESMTGDMMQNPSLAFATTSPTIDRMGIFSLLS
jgi:hypothetical protein